MKNYGFDCSKEEYKETRKGTIKQQRTITREQGRTRKIEREQATRILSCNAQALFLPW